MKVPVTRLMIGLLVSLGVGVLQAETPLKKPLPPEPTQGGSIPAVKSEPPSPGIEGIPVKEQHPPEPAQGGSIPVKSEPPSPGIEGIPIKGQLAETPATSSQELTQQFSHTVEQYVINESQKKRGAFVVHDDELDKDWRLKLERIHKDKIVQLSADRFFACADFREVKASKKGDPPSTIDLDFFVKKTDTGWWVDEVSVHKVNSVPRYTYNRYNQRVPVTSSSN